MVKLIYYIFEHCMVKLISNRSFFAQIYIYLSIVWSRLYMYLLCIFLV